MSQRTECDFCNKIFPHEETTFVVTRRNKHKITLRVSLSEEIPIENEHDPDYHLTVNPDACASCMRELFLMAKFIPEEDE